ncbi:phosphopyruvate hydratase [Dyella jejuensis]|uniref:Enolase n=1 Tax=Dyella jejuensis TaxID=1432009 RepID=A0ABW8JH62_9GAMM
MRITHIDAIEVLDSRGNPTVEAALQLEDGSEGRAMTPSGASTGMHEAAELRDGDSHRYGGKGVQKAVAGIRDEIAGALANKDPGEQRALDRLLCELDGTPNKGRLGANAILAVSIAYARAVAASRKLPLYRHLGGDNAVTLPVPCLNVINGGRHADNTVDFQEFKIVPHHAASFAESIRMGEEVFHALKKLLQKHGLSTGVGDEGGFAPNLHSNEQAIELIIAAIEAAGYRPGEQVALALDPAASEMWHHGRYRFFKSNQSEIDSQAMTALWSDWLQRYPIVLLEDPLSEHDWDGWSEATRQLGNRVELVGDDIFCTNPELLQRGIREGVANSILIKPNQIGTVTETLDCVEQAKAAGYGCYVSHRSGETEDTFIADLVVAIGCGHIKTGSGCRGERTAKFNRLLRIEHELGSRARFAGRAAFVR